MLTFLTQSQNIPFTVALAVMFGIALLEGITTLLGAGLSNLFDMLLPEFDVDIDLDGSEVPSATPLSRMLGWLRIGQVPALILLVLFLTGFGLIGLGIQSFWQGLTGSFLPGILASIPAFLSALFVVRILGGILEKVMPKDETDAVPEETLVGRVAVITLGTASQGSPAEAKVRDTHGTTHYVMLEPDEPGETFEAHTSVLLVKKTGAVFRAIINPNPVLEDQNSSQI